jgi:hypothetical protein
MASAARAFAERGGCDAGVNGWSADVTRSLAGPCLRTLSTWPGKSVDRVERAFGQPEGQFPYRHRNEPHYVPLRRVALES